MIYFLVTLIGIMVLIIGAFTYSYIKAHLRQVRRSPHIDELLKALDEAEKYNDHEGWIAVRKLDRKNYYDVSPK